MKGDGWSNGYATSLFAGGSGNRINTRNWTFSVLGESPAPTTFGIPPPGQRERLTRTGPFGGGRSGEVRRKGRGPRHPLFLRDTPGGPDGTDTGTRRETEIVEPRVPSQPPSRY